MAIVLLLLIAGVIWYFLRRSRRRQPAAANLPSGVGSSTPQRRPSRLSQMGLVGPAGTQRERTGPTVPVIQTSGWGPSNGSEKSPADTLSAVDRRSSYPRVVDQRLEPTALWNPLHDNGSHVSIRSFRDDQDYSRRMLRVSPLSYRIVFLQLLSNLLVRLQTRMMASSHLRPIGPTWINPTIVARVLHRYPNFFALAYHFIHH